MRHMLFIVAALVPGGGLATAQDEKPKAQPVQPVLPKAVQPLPVRPVAVTAAKMAQLEEEAETLDAEREVKKAHIKQAEFDAKRRELTLDRLRKLFDSKVGDLVSRDQIEEAEFALKLAQAQLDIRTAELKVIEVKVKFARKRLEDAKAAGVRPVPNLRPVEPSRVRLAADEKEVAELKAKLAKARDEVAAKTAAEKKAEALVKVAEDDLARLKDAATKGRIRPGAIEALEAKVTEAKAALVKATKERKALEGEVAALQKRLKEIEN